MTLSGVDNTQLRWRGKDTVGLGLRERRRKQQQAPAAHTNREKQPFQAGRLSFLPSDPTHTRAGACVTLAYHGCGQTRQEQKESALVSAPHGSECAVMSLQLCVPRLCKSVSENLGCIPEQQSNSFYYCFVFIVMLAVNMASARLFSFSCFCFPKEEASCGACFFSAFPQCLIHLLHI